MDMSHTHHTEMLPLFCLINGLKALLALDSLMVVVLDELKMKDGVFVSLRRRGPSNTH
jgi:hypothetical protein